MNNCNCGKVSVPAAQVVPVNCEFVIPASYPYVRPVTDSYTCSCCGSTNPAMKDYPASGPYKGNAFALDNAYPYLIDTTYLSYGQALDFSENIYTKVTKRDDASCINLAARFDFTDSSLTNTVRFDFLKNYTARKYEELSGVLPIIKNGIKFRIHYIVYNIDGGIEYEGHTDCKVDTPHFHFTSIKDVFVQSCNGLIIDNIPAMTFQGRYTFCITHVEAMVDIINTKEHLQDPSLNPFYTFIDNNRKIQLHNTEISGMTPDDVLVIGDCQVQQSFEYYANVTTRLRLTFIAFTTLPIACGDTSPIWFALNEPTEQSITQLRNEVTALEDEVEQLRLKNAQQDAEITNLRGQVELNRQNISDLVARVTRLESNDVTQDLDIQRLKERVTILESKDPALVSYKANKELRQAQLTWKGYGQLYQVSQTYYATGDFENDVRLGYLIPVAADAQDVSALAERVEEVATIATDAGSTATAAAETVDGMATTVSELSETVTGLGNNVNTISGDVETLSGTVTTLGETVTTQGTAIGENTTAIGTNTTAITGLNETVLALNNDIDSLDTRVSDLEDTEYSKNKVVVQNLATGVKQYVSSYADAANILNADLEGAYKIYPGEGYSEAALADRLFENTTSLKQIEFPTSMTSLGRNVFAGSGITTLTIPQTITSSSYEICLKCNDLTSVTIDSPNLQLKEASFSTCPNLTTANILSVGKMETTAFYKTGLTEITLPSLDYLNTAAFNMCPNLETAVITSGEIRDHCFGACPNLKTVYIKIGVTAISDSAFGDGNDGIEFFVASASWASAMSNQPWGCTNANIHWSYNAD